MGTLECESYVSESRVVTAENIFVGTSSCSPQTLSEEDCKPSGNQYVSKKGGTAEEYNLCVVLGANRPQSHCPIICPPPPATRVALRTGPGRCYLKPSSPCLVSRSMSKPTCLYWVGVGDSHCQRGSTAPTLWWTPYERDDTGGRLDNKAAGLWGSIVGTVT